MRRRFLSATCVLAVSIGTASAQVQLPPGAPPPKPTTFTPSDSSLTALLNSGWSIFQASGAEGNFLILVDNNARKWMYCELRNADVGSMVRLSLSLATTAVSVCHHLN